MSSLPEPELDDQEPFDIDNNTILAEHTRKEIDEMAMRFCDTMCKEEPEHEEFWTWLKGRIKDGHK